MSTEVPLLYENKERNRLPQKLALTLFSILLVGAGLFASRQSFKSETAVGVEFAVGEYQIGEPIGSTAWGNNNEEVALKEGMFLPVEIDVDGKEEDASKIFWIGFTDDRKTRFKEQVTFKRHYRGPDCWSKWFNDVNKGDTTAKQVDLFMHVPHEPTKLHSIKMVQCIPTKWQAGGDNKPVEIVTLTCGKVFYNGMKDKEAEASKKTSCQKGQDPRDCLSNEEYRKYKQGMLNPLIFSKQGGAEATYDEPDTDPQSPNCGCDQQTTTAPPNACGCEPVQPVTEYLVQKQDPRDYMKNEEHRSVYGAPKESAVSKKVVEH